MSFIRIEIMEIVSAFLCLALNRIFRETFQVAKQVQMGDHCNAAVMLWYYCCNAAF